MRHRQRSDVGCERGMTDRRGSRIIVWENWKENGRGRGWVGEDREVGGGRDALGNLALLA